MTILLLAGQATAIFEICVVAYYIECVIGIEKIPPVPKKLLPCAWKCVKKCTLQSASPNNTAYYCNIGCTLDSCADFYDGSLSSPMSFDLFDVILNDLLLFIKGSITNTVYVVLIFNKLFFEYNYERDSSCDFRHIGHFIYKKLAN